MIMRDMVKLFPLGDLEPMAGPTKSSQAMGSRSPRGKVLAKDPSTRVLDGQFQFWTGGKFLSRLYGLALYRHSPALTTPNTVNISTNFIKIALLL